MSVEIFFGVVAAVVIGTIAWVGLAYSRVVGLFNLKDEAWSGVDVQLKRRLDLVPNLVGTVKDHDGREQAALDNVIEARAMVTDARSQIERIDAENALSAMLRRLFVAPEKCRGLGDDADFEELERELATIDDDIRQARRGYNGTVTEFNSTIGKFPAAFISRKLGYRAAIVFDAIDDEPTAAKAS